MEGNKDEAFRCLQLARRAIELQDFAKALRMAERAQRMFPSSEGAAYLQISAAKLSESGAPEASKSFFPRTNTTTSPNNNNSSHYPTPHTSTSSRSFPSTNTTTPTTTSNFPSPNAPPYRKPISSSTTSVPAASKKTSTNATTTAAAASSASAAAGPSTSYTFQNATSTTTSAPTATKTTTTAAANFSEYTQTKPSPSPSTQQTTTTTTRTAAASSPAGDPTSSHSNARYSVCGTAAAKSSTIQQTYTSSFSSEASSLPQHCNGTNTRLQRAAEAAAKTVSAAMGAPTIISSSRHSTTIAAEAEKAEKAEATEATEATEAASGGSGNGGSCGGDVSQKKGLWTDCNRRVSQGSRFCEEEEGGGDYNRKGLIGGVGNGGGKNGYCDDGRSVKMQAAQQSHQAKMSQSERRDCRSSSSSGASGGSGADRGGADGGGLNHFRPAGSSSASTSSLSEEPAAAGVGNIGDYCCKGAGSRDSVDNSKQRGFSASSMQHESSPLSAKSASTTTTHPPDTTTHKPSSFFPPRSNQFFTGSSRPCMQEPDGGSSTNNNSTSNINRNSTTTTRRNVYLSGSSSSRAGCGGGGAASTATTTSTAARVRENPSGVDSNRQNCSSSAPGGGCTYTAEQVALCTRVLTTKCYYRTLGVERGASEEVIKKAYKKLALLLHPDKNKAPHAEEAFKKISKVFQCLLDGEKRRRYDETGEEEPGVEASRVRYRQEQGITPEDLFQAFFGFTVPGNAARYSNQRQSARFYTRRSQRPNAEDATGMNYLLQILPMALMFLIMFLGNFFSTTPSQPAAVYSFVPTSDLPIHRLTRYHSVKFFVSPVFRREYPDESEKLRELEMTIELKYYHNKCQKEKEELSRQLSVAHYYRASEAKVREILDKPRPHCEVYDMLWKERARRIT